MRLHFNRMRLCLSIFFRPLSYLIFPVIAAAIILYVCMLIRQFESNAVFHKNEIQNRSVSEIENTANMYVTLDSSALNLARTLSSSLNGTDLSFSTVLAKIAPPLFQAVTTIPPLTEVVYIGLSSLAFSYYNDNGQMFAAYSNTSSPSVTYIQPVNHDSGKLFGEAVSSNSTLPLNISTYAGSSERTIAYCSLEMGWNANDLLFKNTVPMDGRGYVSLGFPAEVVRKRISLLDFHGGHLLLATNDGQVLIEPKLPKAQLSVDNGTVSVKWEKPYGDFEDKVTNFSCKLDDGELGYLRVKIKEKKHAFYCSTIKIAGVDTVYVLAFPPDGMETAAHKNSMLTIILLALLFAGIFISVGVFIYLFVKASRREKVLCDALIKQKESTQQAERKSMKKSEIFATNSHDLRASLSTITALIGQCGEDVIPNSKLAANLAKTHSSIEALLGLLTTVLDKSKIEAGKIELVEQEFNLAQVLEEIVDLHYPIGIRKGVDVILDPCDGSILKFYHVRGDRGMLEKILLNLLNNAIKFTSEGHVVVRTMVRKTSKENAIIASNRRSIVNCLSRLCSKTSGSSSLDDFHTVPENPNCMEFIFEIDDTGCGIPKERQNSVFENYFQYNKPASGEGWGLGLGIVQSLVRLMGGEIRIVDKEDGEKGTCFRFNIFLTCNAVSTGIDEHGDHMQNGVSPTDRLHYIGLHTRSPASRLEGSHVVLLLAGKERRKVSKKVIENLGIKVSVAGRGKELKRILDRIKEKLELLQSEKSESSPNEYLSVSSNSNSGLNEGISGTKEAHDCSLPQRRNSNSKGLQTFILIVIDSVAGPSLEVSSVLSSFMKETPNLRCKVVGWNNPIISTRNSRQSKEDMPFPSCDYMLSKPFHGSCLYEVLGLLPEFPGAFPPDSLKVKAEAIQENEGSSDLVPPKRFTQFSGNSGLQQCIISPDEKQQLQEIVIHAQDADQSSEKPLKGKSVLVVDDQKTLRLLTRTRISKLGAEVDVCENGKEAFDMVCKILNDQREIHQKALPYDFIIMDCEMPEMDGYEATRLIRREERLHGIHIPILALTAHDSAEEYGKTVDAGMDFHLFKPLENNKLLDAIRVIEYRLEQEVVFS